MTTPAQIQIANAISAVAHRFYQSGVKPDLDQVFGKVSQYFAQNPPGNPVALDISTITSDTVSDVDALNILLANIVNNIKTLYQTTTVQSNEVLSQNTILRTQIDSLQKRQNKLITQINDYLLSLYNTDGYFFSISDNFTDTSLVDLSLTDAFIDTTNEEVSIPSLAAFSKTVDSSLIQTPNVVVTSGGQSVNYTTISPFNFATNGTNNIAWEIQVSLPAPAQVSVVLTIPLGDGLNPVSLSRIDFEPYAMTAFQMFAEYGTMSNTTNTTNNYTTFGNNITTSLSNIAFIDTAKRVISVRLTMNKSTYDFQTSDNNSNQYVYVFGAKNIAFTEQVYDLAATLVSAPLQLSPDSAGSMVIDAVSVATNDIIPPNTSINYYVAADNLSDATPSISNFQWLPIEPVNDTQTQNTTVSFNGAYQFIQMITQTPKSQNDLQLLPLNSTATDPTQLNPSPLIIPGVNTYTLANFTSAFLPNSIQLEEGVNSTRIYYTNYQASSVSNLDYWSGVINNSNPVVPAITYGRIDQGNGFFYGGDIGANGVSAFIETFLYIDTEINPVLASIVKQDQYSQTWDVRAFLNGVSIGYLPGNNTNTTSNGLTALNNIIIPWNFQTGINHIILAINIPPLSMVAGNNSPYLGVLDLMQNYDLNQFGIVKLANWSYVSFFDLQYNQPGTPTSFSVYNNQIVSKRQPTTNYRLSYSQDSGYGPSAIRFRADLARDINNVNLTPQLDSYRVRFSYGQTVVQ